MYVFCWLQVVTIDRERLISEKQNNKASPTAARLPKEAMLLREIFKFSKPSLDAFRPKTKEQNKLKRSFSSSVCGPLREG